MKGPFSEDDRELPAPYLTNRLGNAKDESCEIFIPQDSSFACFMQLYAIGKTFSFRTQGDYSVTVVETVPVFTPETDRVIAAPGVA